MKLKLFAATVVGSNSCYVQTLLVVDESEELAHKQLEQHLQRRVKYYKRLKEIVVDMTIPNVIGYVGTGENESSTSHYDND